MIITEEELRQVWKNGNGQIPSFPPGTRFTPSAQDFLNSIGATPGTSKTANQNIGATASPAKSDQEVILKASTGSRLIFTAQEVECYIQKGVSKIKIHSSVTLTDAAREFLRKAGIRLIPFTDDSPKLLQEIKNTSPANSYTDEALFNQIKSAVLARINGRVDEQLLDAILRKVLSEVRS